MLGEPDPAAAPGHAEPQEDGRGTHHLAPAGLDARRIGGRHAAADRVGEQNRQDQRRHLHPEGEAVVALHRFGQEQQKTGGEHQDDAAGHPRLRGAGDARHRLLSQSETQQTQIDDQHGPAHERQADQMQRLDDRKEPRRAANRRADPGVLQRLENGQRRHRDPPWADADSGVQPASS